MITITPSKDLMYVDRVQINTGPFLFGDVDAKRFGAIWSVTQTTPMWYQAWCKMIAEALKQ